MSSSARGRENEKQWFWEDSAEQIAPNAQSENPPTHDGWHDGQQKNRIFSVYISYPLQFSYLIHTFIWPKSIYGSDDPFIGINIYCLLVLFSLLTWPTSVMGVTTRWLVSNHFTRANWLISQMTDFYRLLRAYLRRLRLWKIILFHNTPLDRLFDSTFYCLYHGDLQCTTPNRTSWSLWTQRGAND